MGQVPREPDMNDPLAGLVPPPTVVAVDDDPMVLLMVSRTLGAQGMTCHTAASGAEGMQLIRRHQPDLVLLDIVMAGEDGFEVCREIRRTWSAEQMPVVMITTLDDLASIQAAYQAGANDFLAKPLHWKHLPFRIRHVLQANRALLAMRESEERYQRITAATTDYIYTVRLGTEPSAQTTHGPGCLGVTGYRPDEFASDPYLWIHMVEEEDRPAVTEQVRRILAGEDPPPIEHRIRDKQGYRRWVRNTFVPHRDPGGALTSYDGLVQDITERKLAEEALRETNQRLELAALSASLGIWDLNLPDRTLLWNDRMFELYGLDRATCQPSFEVWYQQVVHPEDREMVHEARRAAIEDGKPYRAAFRAVLPNGGIRHIGSNGLVLRDSEGRAVRLIGVNRDRTEQVEAEFERRRLQEERQHSEKLESLGSLAGGIAHDMNNVLGAILGMASALRAACDDGDPRARPLDTILHASARGRDLVKGAHRFRPQGPGGAPVGRPQRPAARGGGAPGPHHACARSRLALDLDPSLPPDPGRRVRPGQRHHEPLRQRPGRHAGRRHPHPAHPDPGRRRHRAAGAATPARAWRRRCWPGPWSRSSPPSPWARAPGWAWRWSTAP